MKNAAISNLSNFRTASGLAPYAGAFGKPELIHLLRRTMFGVSKNTVTAMSGKSMNAVVSALLTDTNNPNDLPLVDYVDPSIALGKEWVTQPDSGTYNGARRNSFKAWWTQKMINQSDSITEKMVIFWHNHFATEVSDESSAYGYWNNALIRKHHLGNFKTFLREMSVDPLMLRYLNGYNNNKTAPDENYARELQELFTVGKDLANHYTEADVKAAAKVLTGFQVRGNNNITVPAITKPVGYFNSARHDTTNKQFSAFYGNKLITGKTGAAGETELDELIDMILLHSEVAKYLCRKLYRFFVYYDIDTATETNVIEPLADILRMNNYEIKPVLDTLFKSEHFYDIANRGCIIKTPLDHNIGIVRESGITFLDNTDITKQYSQYSLIFGYSAATLLNIGDLPNVAGLQAYYQVPAFHEYWINTYTLPVRRNIAAGAVSTNGFGRSIVTDLIAFTKKLDNPSDPNKLVAELLELYISVPLDATIKQNLKITSLMGGNISDTYWTTAWNNYIADPTNATKLTLVKLRLQSVYLAIFNLNEYQLS
jgi:Protein of unknown function (DUF1800)